jgi:hypothetical protein
MDGVVALYLRDPSESPRSIHQLTASQEVERPRSGPNHCDRICKMKMAGYSDERAELGKVFLTDGPKIAEGGEGEPN